MKTTQLIPALALASVAVAADAQEIEFVTVLVNDLKANQAEYLGYVATAKNVPAAVTQLALKVQTYTDTSYTTLLDGGNIDVGQVQQFAQNLPWFTRIEAAITPLGGDSSSAAPSSTEAPSSAAPTSSSEAPASSTEEASSSVAPPTSSSAPVVTSAENGSAKILGSTLLAFGSLVACLF